MQELIAKALSATSESRTIEFKARLDPDSAGEWCEVIKDVVAMANSGGGVIVFGLDDSGSPVEGDAGTVRRIDQADVINKVSKYTGVAELDLEVVEVSKNARTLIAFVIGPVRSPIVFSKPGTYEYAPGKQKSAFTVGSVYFRHGAKSEPGTSDDIRRAIDRRVEAVRKSWISNVKRVVKAPPGTQFVTIGPAKGSPRAPAAAATVRAVSDPAATPIVLTRDESKATGQFLHETVSEEIFDEINNVVDANRVLARGQKRFFLGPAVYYRVYSERERVQRAEHRHELLFSAGVTEFYAPALYWMQSMSDAMIAQTLAGLDAEPKSPHVHFLMRTAVLLGRDFSAWLLKRWMQKWSRFNQPPSFYFTFKEMISDLKKSDPLFVAARTTPKTVFTSDERTISVKELLASPALASALLSRACMDVFAGKAEERSTARTLDIITYGAQVQERGDAVGRAVIELVGDRAPGDPVVASSV